MKLAYKTQGTCSRQILLDIEGDVIISVAFEGGCNGNLQGIGRLVAGQKVDDVIEKLSSIRCGMRQTSCPDQLARALKAYKDEYLD